MRALSRLECRRRRRGLPRHGGRLRASRALRRAQLRGRRAGRRAASWTRRSSPSIRRDGSVNVTTDKDTYPPRADRGGGTVAARFSQAGSGAQFQGDPPGALLVPAQRRARARATRTGLPRLYLADPERPSRSTAFRPPAASRKASSSPPRATPRRRPTRSSARVGPHEIRAMYDTYVGPYPARPVAHLRPGTRSASIPRSTAPASSSTGTPTPERVIIASPCSGHGFKHSAGIGELLAQMALGEQHQDIAKFSFA